MTRAVVILTATLLFASLGVIAQNSSPAGGTSTATAPAQNAQPAAPPNSPAQPQATTGASRTGIQDSAKNGSPPDKGDSRTAGSAELPQTSTILPLLGLLGLGSLVAGLFARR